MKYVLDSTFLIDLLRGVPAAMTRLDALYAAGDDPVVKSCRLTLVAWEETSR